MYWNRSAFGMLFCCGLCTLGLGCAAVDALVSSPAGHSAPKGSSGRMAAIGRMFENQGHYEQATVMYRKALQQEPGNTVALQRLEYIASRNADRTFDSTVKHTQSAIAMADSLNAKDRSDQKNANTKPSRKAAAANIASADVSKTLDADREALMASLQPPTASQRETRATSSRRTTSRSKAVQKRQPAPEPQVAAVETIKADVDTTDNHVDTTDSDSDINVVTRSAPASNLRPAATLQPAASLQPTVAAVGKPLPVPVAIAPLEEWRPAVVRTPAASVVSNSDDSGRASFDSDIRVVNTGWSLDDVSNAGAANVTTTFSEPPGRRSVSRVSYSGTDRSTATLPTLNTEGAWKSSGRLVTLEELLQWTDSPIANRDNLLFALASGSDDGVKALAAAMLAECPVNDHEVDAALEDACADGSDLVRLSARDVLIQRGRITEAGVRDLLQLLTGSNTDIRAQAAASLRNCAGSQFSRQCVSGLGTLLTDRNPEVVAIAANTLGDFGADASEYRDKLVQLLATTDNELVLDAVNTAVNRVPAR